MAKLLPSWGRAGHKLTFWPVYLILILLVKFFFTSGFRNESQYCLRNKLLKLIMAYDIFGVE